MDANYFLSQNHDKLFFYKPELIPLAIPEAIKAELLSGINMGYINFQFFKDPAQLRIENIAGRNFVIVGTTVSGIYLIGVDINTKEVYACYPPENSLGFINSSFKQLTAISLLACQMFEKTESLIPDYDECFEVVKMFKAKMVSIDPKAFDKPTDGWSLVFEELEHLYGD